MTAPDRPGVIRDFFTGLGFFGRGLSMWFRRPGLMFFGVIPAAVSAAVLLVALIAFFSYLSDIVGWLTGFADDWQPGLRTGLQVLAMLALGVGALFLSMIVFTALTLAIGEPFYEKISEQIEDMEGGIPDAVNTPLLRSLARGATDALRLVARSLPLGLLVTLIGFIPVAGQAISPVLGAFVGGWLIAVELAGAAFSRRGLWFKDRRRKLAERRAMTLGFGIPVFLVFLIPGAAILVMPAAVAGVTLLTRKVLGAGAPTKPRTGPPAAPPAGPPAAS